MHIAHVSLVGGLSKSDILVGRGVSTDGSGSSKDGAANAWDVVKLGYKPFQILAISGGDPARSIHLHMILIMWSNFHNSASLKPFLLQVAGLALYKALIA